MSGKCRGLRRSKYRIGWNICMCVHEGLCRGSLEFNKWTFVTWQKMAHDSMLSFTVFLISWPYLNRITGRPTLKRVLPFQIAAIRFILIAIQSIVLATIAGSTDNIFSFSTKNCPQPQMSHYSTMPSILIHNLCARWRWRSLNLLSKPKIDYFAWINSMDGLGHGLVYKRKKAPAQLNCWL